LVIKIQGNPSYYDDMYKFFAGEPRARRFAPEGYDHCYVAPAGGTPAANFALLLRAVERYGVKCQTLYVPRGDRHPVPMDVGRQLRHGTLRSLAEQELRNYEFGRAAALLRDLGARESLVGLAEHARHRLHFDFEPAARALEDAVMPAGGADRELAVHLRHGLDALLDGEPEALIRELYYNARVIYHEGRYLDFLLRLLRFPQA